MTGYGESASSAPAGWYRDPNDPALERYFDGTNWTPRTRPPVDVAPLTPPRPASALRDPREATRVGAAIGDPYGFYQIPNEARFRRTPSTRTVRAPRTPHLLISLLVGILFFSIGYYLHGRVSLPAADTAQATATVTSLNSPIGTSTPNNCRATMTFTANGQGYVSKINVSRWPCHVHVGQTMIVHFNPSDPTTATLVLPGILQVLGWVCVGFGSLVLVLGFVRLFT